MGGRPFPPGPAGLGCLDKYFVIDIGDVSDERHIEAFGQQPASQYVEGDPTANVPDMRKSLNGCAAQVDRRMTGPQRHEVTHGTGVGVVQAQTCGSGGHDVAAYREAEMTNAVAMAAMPSSRPVSPRPSVVVAETDTGAPSRSVSSR